MQRERMASRRMTTTRLSTHTRVQLVGELWGESRARATTDSPNLHQGPVLRDDIGSWNRF